MLFDDFIGLGLGWAGLQAARPKDGHGLRHESRSGVELQDLLPLARCVAGLLEEFPLGRRQSPLALVNTARGQFPKEAFGRMAILALEEDFWFPATVGRRQDNYRSGVTDNLAQGSDAGRFQNLF